MMSTAAEADLEFTGPPIKKKKSFKVAKPRNWKINSFLAIAWPTPFHDDKMFEIAQSDRKFISESKTVLAYKRGRYLPTHSPKLVYMPTEAVMIKMMRACLGLKNLDELWINVSE